MGMKRIFYGTIAAIFSLLLLALPLAAQDSMHFNVPYLCPDGSTYVVHRCATGPKGEFCYFQRDQNSERYNVRSAVANLIGQCKLKSSTAPVAAAAQPSTDLQVNTPYQCAGGLTLTVFQCQKQNGQDYCFIKVEQNGKFLMQVPKPRSETASQLKACKATAAFNPPYLSEFPSIDRVIQGMKVANPRDTALRAMGAFYQLSEIIKTLALPRATDLPDEKKLLDQYSHAQSTLQQVAAKSLLGQQLDLASNPYHFSRSDPKFGFEGIPVWVAFLSPTLQAQFAQIVGGNNPAYNAKVQEERQRAIQELQAEAQAAQAPQPKQDPGAVAMRHCMESGRSDMECLGEGIKVGLIDLAGGNPLAGVLPAEAPGLRLSGVYSAGTFSVSFDQSRASFTCGTLIQQSLPYTLERSGTQLAIQIPISPKPVTLFYRDGKLAGPGPIDVAGQVVIGGAVATTSTGYQTQTETTTQQRQIDAAEAQNYIGTDAVHQNGMEYSVNDPVTTTTYTAVPVRHYTVPTAPKTEQCNVALLPPTGSNVKISDALTQLLGTQGSKSANTAPGLRLAGTYAAAGGLKIEFRDDSATVQCGEAQAAEAYWVLPSNGQLAVKFQNGNSPFTLTVQPNGALSGSGAVQVAGRRMVQSSGNDVHNFVPVNARCPVGTLTATRAQ